MPRPCAIGIYTIFAALPPDVRKVFDLPGRRSSLGAMPLYLGAVNQLAARGLPPKPEKLGPSPTKKLRRWKVTDLPHIRRQSREEGAENLLRCQWHKAVASRE
jgi:hypothetical protein